jgi:hypothetical protein
MRNRSGSVSTIVVTVLFWILVVLIVFLYIRVLRINLSGLTRNSIRWLSSR